MKVAFLFVFVLFSFSFICSFPSFYPVVIFIISAFIIFKCISSFPIVHTDLWTIHTWNKDHSVNDPANDTCNFHFSIDLVLLLFYFFIYFILIDLHYTIYSVKKKRKNKDGCGHQSKASHIKSFHAAVFKFLAHINLM